MPKYLVRVYETVSREVVVIASDKHEAEMLGYDAIMNHDETSLEVSRGVGDIEVEEVR